MTVAQRHGTGESTARDVVLRTDGLVKDYRRGRRRRPRHSGASQPGHVRALDGLDLEVRRGEVFGFLVCCAGSSLY